MNPKASLGLLLLANLVPLVGVLLWDWEVFPLLVLFWFENIIVGIFFILRILFATGGTINGQVAPWFGRLFLAAFFALHYGMFTYGHGLFVFSMFDGTDGARNYGVGDALRVVAEYQLEIAILALALSHGFSFVSNYLMRGEGRGADLKRLMMRPYQRVVVLHLTILFGGFVAMWLGQPIWSLLILVAIKIVVDLRAHRREHQQTDGSMEETMKSELPSGENKPRRRGPRHRPSHRGTGR